jgi:hypothetical protein
VSAAFTAFAFVLVPLLRIGDKRQGVPASAMPAGGPETGHIARRHRVTCGNRRERRDAELIIAAS